ncbi:hypothetical protein H072_7352 [Dactylellina haptotyla CBS 200.50]|uniref:Uncharacterized protein n=1 Tax=Dactylellina haptotyla (strain CBS 200.50) TaxID=1284197 RepID=S8ACT5_DACHA|nr:hypothetical protein H072_7352 [Dactylellina haptotyla CBS 200.50]
MNGLSKNLLNSAAILLAFACFIPKTASKFATLGRGPDIFDVASYEFRGPLSAFDPPFNCQTIRSKEDVITYIGHDSIFSVHWGGCFKGTPTSCCPPSWASAAYYASSRTACPGGYARMISSGLSFNLTSGTQTAIACCPILTYSFSEGSISGNLFADAITLDDSIANNTRRAAKCCYGLGDTVTRTLAQPHGPLTVTDRFHADPIYMFQEASEATTTTGGSSSTPTVQPGSTVDEPPRNTYDVPTDTENSSDLRLSTAAAIGIGVGVGVSVITLTVFLTYYLTKRRMKKTSSAEPDSQDGENSITGIGPEIIDYPSGIGGIEAREREGRC